MLLCLQASFLCFLYTKYVRHVSRGRKSERVHIPGCAPSWVINLHTSHLTSDPHTLSGVTGKLGDVCLNQEITNMAKIAVKVMRIIIFIVK